MDEGGPTGLIDTSFLVRYLTGDPPDLAARARRVIEGEIKIVLSEVVILETAHVLRVLYEVPREVIIDSLIAFLLRSNVETLDRSKRHLASALLLCRPSGRISIADALVWAHARATDIPVFTFDRRFPGDGIAVRDG